MVMCSITILALLIRLRHAMLCPRVPQLEPVRAYNLINPHCITLPVVADARVRRDSLKNQFCCSCSCFVVSVNLPLVLHFLTHLSSNPRLMLICSYNSSNKLFYLQFNPMSFVGALMESGATKN